jgi:hypothetical protein
MVPVRVMPVPVIVTTPPPNSAPREIPSPHRQGR